MAGGGTSTRRRAIWWSLVAAGLAASGVATGAASSAAGDDAAAAGTKAASIRIVQVRATLRRSHLAEVDEMALQVFDLATQAEVDSARALRQVTRSNALTELTAIAHGSGPNASEAGALVSLLDDDDVTGGVVQPLTLFDAGRAAARDVRPVAGELPTDVEQLYDVMRLDSIGHQILNDALDAAYVERQPTVPAIMEDYFAESEPYITSDGGYLGPDPDDPLADSYVWYPTATTALPLYDEISDLVASSGLWEYDQWIVSWQSGDPGPAPMTLDQLLQAATTVDTAVRARVDDALAAARADALDDQSSATTRERLWLGATALLGAALVALGALAARASVRRVRERHRLAHLDPLTGVGTRHLLDERTARLLADPTYASHLIAVIDMDRFKLINDTWGHAVGDLVLVEVAKRLQQIVDDVCLRRQGSVGTLVRLGGDEFLLSLHSRGPLDPDDLRRRLEDARLATIVAREDERVDLSFSIGLAALEGPGVLSEAMDAADLATYEDKANRGVTAVDRAEPSPAGGDVPSDDQRSH